MIDYNNLTPNIDKQVFNATDGVTWETWIKPSGFKTAYIICIGGGGGGGGGYGNSSNLNRGGSGGGGSSAITIAQVPFFSIPDTLYILVGLGGAGGNANSNGSSGGTSYVCCYPTTNMYDCLVTNGGAAGGGSTGGLSINGNGGSAGTVLTNSSTINPRYLSLCNWVSYAGDLGSTGTTNSTILNGSITCAGAGSASAGNGISGSGGQPLCSDPLAPFFASSLSVPPFDGNAGYLGIKPFFFVGGYGGSSLFNGTGGLGGVGNIGSGGGGGGAGITGGKGGKGGNGLVMIISY